MMVQKILIIALLSISCGSIGRPQSVRYVRDYRFFVEHPESVIRNKIRELGDFFNRTMCYEVFRFVDDPSQANSSMRLVKGLQKDYGKIGWGQLQSTLTVNTAINPEARSDADKTYVYSGKIEFDWDYFVSKVSSQNEEDRIMIQNLALHEGGHVLGLGHVPDPRQIMFENITADSDRDNYRRVAQNQIGIEERSCL